MISSEAPRGHIEYSNKVYSHFSADINPQYFTGGRKRSGENIAPFHSLIHIGGKTKIKASHELYNTFANGECILCVGGS
jgi:hypothetical protein